MGNKSNYSARSTDDNVGKLDRTSKYWQSHLAVGSERRNKYVHGVLLYKWGDNVDVGREHGSGVEQPTRWDSDGIESSRDAVGSRPGVGGDPSVIILGPGI